MCRCLTSSISLDRSGGEEDEDEDEDEEEEGDYEDEEGARRRSGVGAGPRRERRRDKSRFVDVDVVLASDVIMEDFDEEGEEEEEDYACNDTSSDIHYKLFLLSHLPHQLPQASSSHAPKGRQHQQTAEQRRSHSEHGGGDRGDGEAKAEGGEEHCAPGGPQGDKRAAFEVGEALGEDLAEELGREGRQNLLPNLLELLQAAAEVALVALAAVAGHHALDPPRVVLARRLELPPRDLEPRRHLLPPRALRLELLQLSQNDARQVPDVVGLTGPGDAGEAVEGLRVGGMGGGEVGRRQHVVDHSALEAEAVDEPRLQHLHGLCEQHRVLQLRPRAVDVHGEGDLAVAEGVDHSHPHMLLHLLPGELEAHRPQLLAVVGDGRDTARAQLLLLLLRRPGDGREVPFQEGEQLRLLDVAAEGEDEVGGIVEAAAEEGGGQKHIDVVNVGGLEGHEEVVGGGVERQHPLREQRLRAPPLVLDLLPRHPQQHRHLVLAGLQLGGEEQMDHLQRRLEVGWAALASEGARVGRDLSRHRHPHPRQHVHQLPGSHSEGSDLARDGGAHAAGQELLLAQLRQAAHGEALELDLVVEEVGLLVAHAHPVAEHQLRHPHLLELGAGDDAPGGGRRFEHVAEREGFALLPVGEARRQHRHLLEHASHALDGEGGEGAVRAVVEDALQPRALGPRDLDDTVARPVEVSRHRRHLLARNPRQHCLAQQHLVLHPHRRLRPTEVFHILRAEELAVVLVLLQLVCLQVRHEVGLGPAQLSLREASPLDSLNLHQHCPERPELEPLLHGDGDGAGLHYARRQADGGDSAVEGRVQGDTELVQAIGEGLVEEVLEDGPPIVLVRVDRLPRALAVDDHGGVGCLLVFEDGKFRLELVRKRHGQGLVPVVDRRDVESLLNHSLHLLHSSAVVLEISHRHHRHPPGMIPLLVELAHDGGLAVLDHVDLAYGQPPRVGRAIHEGLEVVFICPPMSRAALPPLLHDDTPLVVHVLVRTSDVEGPLPQHGQAALKQVVRVDRHPEEVDGLIERCIGVLTGPELRPDGFEELHHLECVEHGCSSERKMLHKVCHSLLVLVLVH
eukprot:746140-Hanusia_phi.AAC.4